MTVMDRIKRWFGHGQVPVAEMQESTRRLVETSHQLSRQLRAHAGDLDRFGKMVREMRGETQAKTSKRSKKKA